MKFFNVFTIAVLLVAAIHDYGLAQDEPTLTADGIVLTAPEVCEVGELVRLDARRSNVDSLVWDILPGTNDFEVVDDGKRAFFSARTRGEYLIMLAGAKDGQAFQVYHRLTVRGSPTPLTGLAAKIGRWLQLLPDGVHDKDRKLQAMAGIFRRLSEEPVEPDRMIEATALAQRAVLGDDLEAWAPFLDKLGSELDARVDAGELETVEQFRTAWAEIAAALSQFATESRPPC